jgi:O-succinylbenzoate synthase
MPEITAVSLHRVRIPMHEPFRIASGEVRERESVLVCIEDAGGLVGWGESAPMPGSFYSAETPDSSADDLRTRLIPEFLAHRDRPLESLIEETASAGGDPFARAGLEGALWDLLSRRRGVPLFSLLGGSRRPIESGAAIGLTDGLGDLLDRVDRFLLEGYRRIKIKIMPGWDAEPLSAIRDQFGAIPLMADANGSYRLADHRAELLALDRFEMMMIEQPLVADALDDSAELQRSLRTPICADESAGTIEAIARIARRGAAKIVNIKVQRVGGLSNARRMHDACLAAHLPCWLGTMPELGIASAQGLHLATLPGFTYPTDVEASVRWYTRDIIVPQIMISNEGRINIPQGSLNGYEADELWIARARMGRKEERFQ